MTLTKNKIVFNPLEHSPIKILNVLGGMEARGVIDTLLIHLKHCLTWPVKNTKLNPEAVCNDIYQAKYSRFLHF